MEIIHLVQFQVSSLKYEVDSRKKTSKDLEARIAQAEKRHWETVSQSETTKKDLEKKQVEKFSECQDLRKTVDHLERKVYFFSLINNYFLLHYLGSTQ